MASTKRRFDDNVPGLWYVDDQCIDCGLCGNDVPALFSAAADYGHHRVHRQPVSEEELREASEALERCPAEAIGNDGAA